jgi:hypothetical protein
MRKSFGLANQIQRLICLIQILTLEYFQVGWSETVEAEMREQPRPILTGFDDSEATTFPIDRFLLSWFQNLTIRFLIPLFVIQFTLHPLYKSKRPTMELRGFRGAFFLAQNHSHSIIDVS